MALTYRSVKGSALTIDELDNNFRHFTGSHAVTGSLTISGSGTLTNIGPFNQTGASTLIGSTTVTGSLIVSASSATETSFISLTGETTVVGTTEISGSTTITGSLRNIGPFNQIGLSTFTGNLTSSGDLSCQNITASSYSFSSITSAVATDATFYSINTKRGEVRSQLQSIIPKFSGSWNVELRNTDIKDNSLIIANIVGGFGGIVTGSSVVANVVGANTASLLFHNIGGSPIPNDSPFTASFAVL